MQAEPEGNGATPNTIAPYKMTTEENGVALVINNTKWKKNKELKDRVECEGDTDKIENVLEELNYRNIQPRNDLTLDAMKKEIEKAAKKIRAGIDCSFMLVLMSHGGEKGVYGVNSDTEEAKQLSIDEIIKILTDEPKLITIPKIIFINCCRGDQVEPPAKEAKSEGRQLVHDGYGRVWLPRCSDLYISYSTLPQNIAVRLGNRGALYIDHLCETLTKYAGSTRLDDMITLVNDSMATELVKIGEERFLQCGHVVHTMRKPFFFKPRQQK